MKSIAQQNIDRLQDAYSRHKQLETDMSKVKKWVEQAKTLCGKPLLMDSPVELLEELVKKYQAMESSGNPHQATIGQIGSRLESVKSGLSDADTAQLKEEVCNLKEGFERTWEEVTSRLKSLVETIENRRKFEEDIRELGKLVLTSQGELKKLNRGVAPDQQELKEAIVTAEVGHEMYSSTISNFVIIGH